MPTLIDSKFEALRAQGFTGSMSDMTLQWLQANGATSNQIPDAWNEVLSILVSTAGANSDRWYVYLKDSGFGGTDQNQINDMELAFWLAGGLLTPLPDAGSYSSGYSTGYY